MLRELFKKQAELNKRTGFDPDALRADFDPQTAGIWLNNYIAAMSNELEELRDCTFWKHWCKEAKEGKRFFLHDLQNARVEVIDMLFFWMSLAQCLGLDADDCLRLYEQKWQVNWKRQDNDYSMATKTEDDNKNIILEIKRQKKEKGQRTEPRPLGVQKPDREIEDRSERYPEDIG